MKKARRRCTGKNRKTGKPCQLSPIHGGFVCHKHGGQLPVVKNKAKERIRQYVADMVDPDRVLQEAARMGFSDLRQAFDEKGRLLKNPKDWPDDLAAAVSSTKTRTVNLDSADGHTDEVTELKVWDKSKNIELLAKHLGLLKETLNLRGGLEIRWKGGE